MATSVTAGVNEIVVAVDDPSRDDFGGMYVWRSVVNGFTPGPANLVYSGKDFTHIMKGLAAGTTYYIKVALFSEIDPNDFLTSAQFSATPTAPIVAAEDVQAGDIRGANVFAATLGTKGTTITDASLALGAGTVNVKNTADFPASGSAMIFDPVSNDRDTFTYAGKTATSFTGCGSVAAHAASSGLTVIPLNSQLMVVDSKVGEMRFWANRGDGVYEEMANIGITSATGVGGVSDTAMLSIGSLDVSFTKIPVYVKAGKTHGVYAYRNVAPNGNEPLIIGRVGPSGTIGPAIWGDSAGVNGYASFFSATGAGGTGLHSQASDGNAIVGSAYGSLNTGHGVWGKAERGAGVRAETVGQGMPFHIVPHISGAPNALYSSAGGMYVTAANALMYHNGSGWVAVRLAGDVFTLLMADGSAAAPSLRFDTNPTTGLYRAATDRLAFSAAGVQAGYISAAGSLIWNTVINVPQVTADAIKFPATQVSDSNVNTLDDYEEGTFTPVVEGAATAGTGTYTEQVGRYTKIGNRVLGTIALAWSAHTGTGAITITGLPFTSRNVAGNDSAISVAASGLTYTGELTAYILSNASQFILRQQATGVAITNVAMDTVVNGFLKISFQYETDT